MYVCNIIKLRIIKNKQHELLLENANYFVTIDRFLKIRIESKIV